MAVGEDKAVTSDDYAGAKAVASAHAPAFDTDDRGPNAIGDVTDEARISVERRFSHEKMIVVGFTRQDVSVEHDGSLQRCNTPSRAACATASVRPVPSSLSRSWPT